MNGLTEPDIRVLTTIITVFLGVAGGATGGAKIILWIIQRQFHAAIEAIERIPEQSWFDQVNEGMLRIPDPKQIARIEAHLIKGHEHTSLITYHGMEIETLRAHYSDHERRLRELERGGGDHEARMRVLEERKHPGA